MDLRVELLRRLRAGERMSELCREYGISRKTGHKFKRRLEQDGVAGLADKSRAPVVVPHRTPPALVELLLDARRRHPTWGGKKLKRVYETKWQRALPSGTAIQNILKRHGLITPRRRNAAFLREPTTPHVARQPNDVWCIDYKGQFRLGDRSYCYPLTITDQFSREVLACEGMAAVSDEEARDVCMRLFREVGLPTAIRSDNGAPFASTGLAGLTKLSALWLRLGIARDRIRPAHPEENGQHERMHRTLKAETTRPARRNLLQQQERFDEWRVEFNTVRPHEALGMRPPAEVYRPSLRACPRTLPELSYLEHDDVLEVSRFGRIRIAGVGLVHITKALAGQPVGIREAHDGRWLVTFVTLDLGYVDPRTRAISPISKDLI